MRPQIRLDHYWCIAEYDNLHVMPLDQWDGVIYVRDDIYCVNSGYDLCKTF